MTVEHTEKLKEFLKKQPNNFKHGILFFYSVFSKTFLFFSVGNSIINQ
jgi:hypothetical protein